MGLLKNLTEHIPGASFRKVNPYIWRIFTPVYLEAKRIESVDNNGSVFFVETNYLMHGLHTVDSSGDQAKWDPFLSCFVEGLID